ncbi:MAG: glycosyltransferase family 2 protein [Pseudomonadota bacterium]
MKKDVFVRVSVVTVCRNAAKSIPRTIESVLGQDYGDVEYLILDGASTDGTQDVVAPYLNNGVTFISQPDGGMYHALNGALTRFTGDVFGTLNADDAFHDRTALTRIADALLGADMVHGDLDFVAAGAAAGAVERKVTRRWRVPARPAGGFRTGWMPAHPTFYAKRHVVEAVGAFDTALKTAADYDYMLRAIELHPFSLAKAQGVLVDMATGGRSTASVGAHVRHNLEALSSRRRWLGAGPIDAALVAKPARKIGQFVSARF